MRYHFALALILVFSVAACGKKAPEGDGEQGGDGNGSGLQLATSLIGTWSGLGITNDGSKIENASVAITDKTVSVSLSATKEFNGARKIVGTYQSFQNRSLLIALTESTLTEIGDSGNNIIMDYEFVVDDLELKNNKLDLKLKRVSNGEAAANPDAPKPLKDKIIVGTWGCVQANQETIELTIYETGRFHINGGGGDTKIIFLDGSASWDDINAVGKMVVDNHSPELDMSGATYKISDVRNQFFKLQVEKRKRRDGKETGPFDYSCDRK